MWVMDWMFFRRMQRRLGFATGNVVSVYRLTGEEISAAPGTP